MPRPPPFLQKKWWSGEGREQRLIKKWLHISSDFPEFTISGGFFGGFPIKRLWSTWNLCPILGTQNFLLTRVFHKSNLVCHSGKIPMRAGNWLNWIHATKTIHFQGMMFDTTQSLGMDFFTHCKTRTRHRANFSASYDTAWSSRWKGAELQGQFQATSNIIFHPIWTPLNLDEFWEIGWRSHLHIVGYVFFKVENRKKNQEATRTMKVKNQTKHNLPDFCQKFITHTQATVIFFG